MKTKYYIEFFDLPILVEIYVDRSSQEFQIIQGVDAMGDVFEKNDPELLHMRYSNQYPMFFPQLLEIIEGYSLDGKLISKEEFQKKFIKAILERKEGAIRYFHTPYMV